MLINSQLVKDPFGQYYKIQTGRDKPAPEALKAEIFHNNIHATRFISNLTAPISFWSKIYNAEALISKPIQNNNQLISAIAELFSQGKIKAFKIEIPSYAEHAPEKRTITDANQNQYTFTQASTLLISNPKEVKTFTNIAEAKKYLAEIAPDENKLKEISQQLNVPSNINSDPFELIANSLASGEIVIMVDKYSAPPANKQSADNTVHGDKSPGNGPEAAAAITGQDKEKPSCTLDWVSIECSHGRNTGISKKTTATPTLAVVSTETKEKDFDTITAEIHASALCDEHKSSSFSISQEHKLKSKTDTKIEFKVNCGEWNFDSIFDRVWLPTITPKTYNISIKDTCEAPDIKIKDVNVDVYPDIKWHWGTTIDFGKLEFVPGQSKIEYSDFDIKGNVILTYEGEEHNAEEKYKKYIKQPLDGFKKICNSIATVLEIINDPKAALMRIGTQTNKPPPKDNSDNKDGNETRLIVDWPKLTIDYDSTLIENSSPDYVDHDYSIKLKAAPLIDIDIQVDVLDSLMSLAPLPVAELMRYAKKRVEGQIEEDQAVGLRGELDVIFTVKTTVNITESEIKGTHNISESDSTVEPIKGDICIPATLKGAVKAEGKWFIISFTVDYSMEGKSEWAGDFEFANDDKGIYFSNSVEFKGIDVTLTKYEEVKGKVTSDTSQVDDMFSADGEISFNDDAVSVSLEDGDLSGEAKLTKKAKNRWSWLKSNKDTKKKQPVKYYLVKR